MRDLNDELPTLPIYKAPVKTEAKYLPSSLFINRAKCATDELYHVYYSVLNKTFL